MRGIQRTGRTRSRSRRCRPLNADHCTHFIATPQRHRSRSLPKREPLHRSTCFVSHNEVDAGVDHIHLPVWQIWKRSYKKLRVALLRTFGKLIPYARLRTARRCAASTGWRWARATRRELSPLQCISRLLINLNRKGPVQSSPSGQHREGLGIVALYDRGMMET
jgi:hypothetical protein